MARVIDDAREDQDGVITHVRFKGNERFTSVDRAIPMAERGKIEPRKGEASLREW